MAANATIAPGDPILHRTADWEAAEEVFDDLQRCGMTESGREWCEDALDPFHDKIRRTSGLPDFDQSFTVPQRVDAAVSLNAPVLSPPLGPDDKWALHIFTTPLTATEPLVTGLVRGAEFRPQPQSIQGTMGTLTILKTRNTLPFGWSNDPNGPGGSLPSAGDYEVEGLSIVNFEQSAAPEINTWTADAKFMNGKCRVTSMGFEVSNSTPLLTNGGTCTPYRQNNKFHDVYGFDAAPTGATPGLPTVESRWATNRLGRLPPATLKEVKLLPNRSWPAREGCYCVNVLEGFDIPFSEPMPIDLLLKGPEAAGSGGWANSTLGPNGQGVLGIKTDFASSGFVPLPYPPGGGGIEPTLKTFHQFSQTGVVFTDLPLSATFMLTLRLGVERAPSASETDLVVLAQPSPQYDSLAWTFYSETARQSPVGAMLKENALGTHFVKTAKNLVKGIDRALEVGLPIAEQLAPAFGPKAALAVQATKLARGAVKGRRKKKVAGRKVAR